MTNKAEKETMKIRDLVEVPEIKTVIQLEDLKDAGLSRMIVDTFVITAEVLSNLEAIFASLRGGEGRGIFLKGHFGSGKSHFLSMLSLLLRDRRSWETVLSQAPSLSDSNKELVNTRFFAKEISLVQHRGSEFLEDIVLRNIFGELWDETSGEFAGAETRHETFLKLKGILKDKGFTGMVLLVDELSEFLRSKPDARAYNEDIRFLQYLGEEAGTFPLWVIASLQEWIEETGEIHQDTFNKIKDRFRIRLNLGRAHIEELVSERLIRHKEGTGPIIGKLYDDLKTYFPTFPVSRERFIRLYPVHPATSTLLDKLKPLFSEHRGVVEFIHFRLKGDPERHIPSWLDRPAHELLTPEVIFDHFLDRIRERSETQIYVERVFEAFQQEIPGLFQDPDQGQIALVAIKLLILFAISPIPFKYTVRHMAEMVLFQITPLEAEINYQFFYEILERLAKEGSYVRVETRDDPLDNHYFIDLKADMAGIMRRRIRHTASQLFPEDRRLFTGLAAMVDSSYLPLAGWIEKGRQQVSVQWQHTRRNGVLLLRQLDELSKDEVSGLGTQWAKTEDDFFILVGTTHNRDNQYRHVKEDLLPVIREHSPGTFLFWIPGSFEGDLNWLKETLAAALMMEQMDPGSSERGRESHAFLRAFLDRERPKLTEHFTHLYYQGVLLWDENQVDLSPFGHLSQEKFLSEFVRPLLERRFPRHTRIQPYMDAMAPSILKDMLKEFFSSGMLLVDDRSKFGIRNILEGLLSPMGLVKKKGNQYELQVLPKQNELVRHFLEKMGQRETVALEEMYWAFRKGDYGLLMSQFEILALALLFSGHLLAYKGMKRKGLEDLARDGLKGITALGRGEILGEDLRKAVAPHPLIPKRFKNIPFTLALQEELWVEIKSEKPGALEGLEALKSRVQWAASFEAFKNMPWEDVLKDIQNVLLQWDEVKVSLLSREGLERFISAARREPLLDDCLKTIHEAHGFLEHAERALFIYQYVTDPRLHLPDGEDYAPLRQSREEILRFYREPCSAVSLEALREMFQGFQAFHEQYIRTYVDAHHRARGGSQFEAYEQLTRSRRYKSLKGLDQLEMVSVEHNRRSIEQGLSQVLLHRCLRSPQDQLQAQPVCVCGFCLGERTAFRPLKELETGVDKGIAETLDALKASAMQEKILPYLEGLDLVGKKDQADAIRRFLHISPQDEGFFVELDEALTSQVIQDINEAFRGKVVVVKRDLDRLYQSLVHRKYTLAQTRKLLGAWLKEETLSEDTFVHFLGKGEREPADQTTEAFEDYLQEQAGHLEAPYKEFGHDRFVKAMITSLWADQYNIGTQKFLEIFSFLDRGAEGENSRWVTHLAELAMMLRSGRPELFEAMVSKVEEDSALIQTLWSLLPTVSPQEIFLRESIFPLVLKEAFERLLSTESLKIDLGESIGFADQGLADRPVFQERREEMVEALKTYQFLNQKVSSMKIPKDSGHEAFSRWESLFIETVSPLASLMETLHEKLGQIGTRIPPFLKQEGETVTRKLHEVTEHFIRFYGNALPLWEKGEGKRPMMIHDIPLLLSKKRGVPDHKKAVYLLMDGMRWDLWEAIKSEFFGKMPNHFRVARQGVLWANQPSDTPSQLERLGQSFRSPHPDRDHDDVFWKITGIDERVHMEKGPLPLLFANVIRYLEIDLLFRLRKLPSKTLLILFSDHGFVENPAFTPSQKYEAPRYFHGKDSPFEVIIPWAWVMRL